MNEFNFNKIGQRKVRLSEACKVFGEQLKQGKCIAFTIKGSSMYPLFMHDKTEVLLVGTDKRPVRVNEIVLYARENGSAVLHRIVEKRKDGYVTLGDNGYRKEYPVLPSQIIGVVESFKIGRVCVHCSGIPYKIFVGFWNFVYPARQAFHLVSRGLDKIFS